MVDDDTGRDGPSLELPKLGRRRPTATKEPKPPKVPKAPKPPKPPKPPKQVETKPERRPRPPVRLPHLDGMLAAVLIGLVVGLGIVGLTWASLRGCEAVQGTSSCGGVGYPMLGVILAAMVVVGAVLLRLAQVPEPGSTSFLAVGLTAVLALMFLVDSLLDRAMIVVLPLICAGSFAAAHWVTRTFVEPPTD
ncbi:hypothetical protein [Nocardioides sp. SR21]|uniref:hypothetical protein n=1 Tax=Nocardioides sp. SR21 TaxID=2919501 RepID=UPI001FAAAFA0|nr:hypothetical protein [Nocardioides sp. SR21]